MTQTELLTEARALIAQGWTQHYTARDAAGDPVPTNKQEACSFCAVGALMAVGRPQDFEASLHAAAVLLAALPEPFTSIVDFNDAKGRTQDEVLALFDLAIAKTTLLN